MGQLDLSNLRKSFGLLEVVKGVDLTVHDGEFVVFVGPSGCGKSTMLRMIAGLEDATNGDIVIDGNKVNNLAPVKRGIAMVFQSYALYPHMSVFENIAFPLRVERLPEAEVKQKVGAAADILQLGPLLEKRPGTLSGGQRQRVAIGRAIVRQPEIFLFDEPLSNLDATLRAEMRVELSKLHGDLDATMVYVTHDQVEAMTMADRIVVLNEGEIAQVGTPLELYHKPENTFVAAFIGNPKMNFLPVTATGSSDAGVNVRLQNGAELTVPVKPQDNIEGTNLQLGFRPEHCLVDGGDVKMDINPTVIERLGVHTVAYAALFGETEDFCCVLPGTAKVREKASLSIGINAGDCHLFNKSGQALERQVDLSEIDESILTHE